MDAVGKKRWQLSVIIGVLGGAALILVNCCKFEKGETYGNLLLLVYLIVIASTLIIQRYLFDEKLSYFKNVGWGLIPFYIANIIFTIGEVAFAQAAKGKTLVGYLVPVFLGVSGMGIVISLIVAALLLLFQNKTTNRKDHPGQ